MTTVKAAKIMKKKKTHDVEDKDGGCEDGKDDEYEEEEEEEVTGLRIRR